MTEEEERILEKIRARGALKECTECGGRQFEYVGRSTGAAIFLNPDETDPSQLLPNTRSYKTHIIACTTCYRILGFIDKG